MSDYLTDFVQESEERITELNNALLTLERDPGNEEAMENIFRIAHTLKGNCGAMGLESASDLAHAIEDLLDAVRGDEIEVSAELMDVIFDAVDELEAMIDEVAADGEIETDPTATIAALREHLASSADEPAGITTPTSDEIDDVCARFEPPADDGHDVYLARLAIAERDGVNNGKLVVDALIDAFDLMGTDPPHETIKAGAYGYSFDAVFGTAVGEAAIASGLEPVEEVEEFEIVDVTDRFDADEADRATADPADDTEPGDGISADEAMDLEVDDLLDEFDEFDDLDEMVEDVEDEELEAFEDMGEAGSFDDLLDENDVDELDAEPGEPPADSHEGEQAGDSGDDEASDDGAEDVEDAGAVFNELKEEVEMVGFDELQDELEELEFDEFDDEEEVDMDELLGEDAADDSFLGGSEPTESDVDDILVDSAPTDETTETDGAVDADGSAPAGEPTSAEPTAEPDDSEPEASTGEAAETAALEDDVSDESGAVGAVADEDASDEDAGDEMADDEVVAVEDEDDIAAEDDVVARDDSEPTTDDVAVDDAVPDDPVEADPAATDGEAVELSADDSEPTDAASLDEADEAAAVPVESDPSDDDADEAADDATESGVPDETTELETDDATALAEADEADEFQDEDRTTVADDDTDTDDGAASDSFGTDEADDFEPAAAFDDEFDAPADETDPFDDADDFELEDDDSLDEFDVDPDETDLDADDDFEVEFDDPLDTQSDAAAFAGTEEFDTTDAGFDSPATGTETDPDSSAPSAGSFGDDAAGSGDEADSDVVRIVNEPEMEIPDIDVPDTTDRPDADAETDEIQSVRVDVEQIDSLLTLVEGLVTSRVRLRHAADSTEDGSALDTELDALSDLTTDLQETVMDIRLVPLQTVTNRLPRVVRDIARDQDKTVSFEMTGEDVEIDRSILDRIGDPLIHLVRNAVDHGIEAPERREEIGKPREGTVEVHAERERDRVTITVDDDGNGLDPDRLRSEAVEADIVDESTADSMSDQEVYDLIFHPGLSTADEVTDVSGRGVGMDVVKRTIQDLDGTVSIDSTDGEGTTVTMELPVTVAIDEILFVESGGEEFGVPTKAVQDIESAMAMQTAGGESVLPGEDRDYPVIPLADVFETPAPGANGDGMVVRIRDDVREVALHCDHVHGQQEVVVKPFEGFMSDIPGLSGATVRGRGEVVNILDVTTL
ncbi:Hpt domain-containing protein [Natrinema salaciae]|uniref:Chemotaxis protein CheA n=1 Tax=Natrinema salaciae TaxID=1186196 RepID=A0A1H9FZ25_9EURY|nr:Hpt domain-containing protein [Natrinema salaciae]SEQ43160.1 two-component system, chemotaxis family, sensor kinase CheA [Natrinema salaciae]